MTDEKLLTVSQLAAFLQVSEESVRRYTRAGDLKCSKLGRQLRFSRTQIEDFLQRFADKELPSEEPEDTTQQNAEPIPAYIPDFMRPYYETQEAQTESDSKETETQYLNEDGEYL